MSGHTPGPWFVWFSTAESTWTVQHSGGWIARVLDVEPRRPGKANARLIAAAPELLGGLKAARELLDCDWPPELEALIAKAEGR